MSVVVGGVDHLHAPFDLVERITVSETDLPKFLAELRSDANLGEVVVLSTCLRTEIYAVVDRFHDGVTSMCTALAERAGISTEAFEEEATILFDRGVATHLFSVASGLYSAVPGESEVLGQVRRALEHAREEAADGQVLGTLFQHAVETGRKVRHETSIGRGSVSFSHAALELVRQRFSGSLAGQRAVLVGAGALGESVGQALAAMAEADRPASLTLVNRTAERAEALALALAELRPSLAAFDDLSQALAEADLLVVAVEADHQFIDTALLAQRDGSPLLIADLGMPRTVSAEVRSIAEVSVLDVSDMSQMVNSALDARRAEVSAAEAVISREVERHEAAVRARGAAPVVTALRERVEALRLAELERRRSELADLTPEQYARVEEITRAVANKLLHEPTVALRDSAGSPRGQRMIEAIRSLFDL